MYIISGRGRKSGVARATGATASLAPLEIVVRVVLTLGDDYWCFFYLLNCLKTLSKGNNFLDFPSKCNNKK